MFYTKTPQGFIRVYSDPNLPLTIRKEVSKHLLAKRVVDYSDELKSLREKHIYLKEENKKLRDEINLLRKRRKIDYTSEVSLSSLINEVNRRTNNKAKLALFKEIIKDNVHFRGEK